MSQPQARALASLETLNHGSRAEFFESVNILFETAPPLADLLFAKRYRFSIPLPKNVNRFIYILHTLLMEKFPGLLRVTKA